MFFLKMEVTFFGGGNRTELLMLIVPASSQCYRWTRTWDTWSHQIEFYSWTATSNSFSQLKGNLRFSFTAEWQPQTQFLLWTVTLQSVLPMDCNFRFNFSAEQRPQAQFFFWTATLDSVLPLNCRICFIEENSETFNAVTTNWHIRLSKFVRITRNKCI